MGMKAQHGHRWTDEEIKTLMKQWDEGVELDDICESMGHTRFAISKMVVRLRTNGVPMKRRTRGHRANRSNQLWTQSEVEYLIRRRKDKATAETIAAEMGRTVLAVNGMIGQLRRNSVNVEMLGMGVRRLWNADILRAQYDSTSETVQ
jgi:biotin operon repressor